MLKFIFCFLLVNIINATVTDKIITSWIQATGVKGYNNILANVQKVVYSNDYVYVSCTDIPSYSIGPWSNNPNTASNQDFTFKFPRSPQSASTKSATPLGHIGVWINGVSIFNALDAMSYNNQGIWMRNAYYWEASSFDSCSGHPPQSGEYHHHVNPKCLYNYTDSTVHSPIIGFAFDGYPIYGSFGYSSPLDTSSALKRIRSSYQKRNITVRHVLANGTSLSSSQYGPDVSSTYPLGAYINDYVFTSGSGDLDVYNGRFTKTPEYPSGTYAYFVTTDNNGDPEYPYTIGPYYYGTLVAENTGPTSGKSSPSEAVTTYFSYNNSSKCQLNLVLVILLAVLQLALSCN